MSHIAKFNLKIENEDRLKSALRNISTKVTDGYFTTAWASMNRDAKIEGSNRVVAWNNKPVVVGAEVGNGYRKNSIGFTRQEDSSLELVGDTYGTGMSTTEISNIIENAYVNEAVEEIVPDLFSLGFIEESEALVMQKLY